MTRYGSLENPTTLDIQGMIQAQESGRLTAQDLIRAHLERIESLNPGIGAFIHVDRDRSMARAREIDRARAAGEPLGPLAGVPVALKANFMAKGLVADCASRLLEGFVPAYDGTHAARLQAAGAVILGTTNMDEFAMGSSTQYSIHGPTRNPWDPARVPGGSSGGSAAAVAAGMAAAALGTDTGGSIRQPAGLCGVVGLKPTYGRVSRSGFVAHASSMDQAGPMTRSVRDAARVLQVIGGHDPMDSTSVDLPQPDYVAACDQGIRGMVAGVPREFLESRLLADDVRATVRGAVERLSDAGLRIEEVGLPMLRYSLAVYRILSTAEASSNLARFDGVRYGVRAGGSAGDLDAMYSRTRARGFGHEVTLRILLGTYSLSSDFVERYHRKAMKVRTLVAREFQGVLRTVDVLITPTSPVTAFRLGEKLDDPGQLHMQDALTLPANLAGIPGMTVPAGFDTQGLPIGMQILARPFDEVSMFRVAAAWEAMSGLGGMVAGGGDR